MQICGPDHQWYAIRAASGREKAVSHQLHHKGYEEFLPLYRSRRQWCDRAKELELPLFPGYLFCRFDVHNRLPILITPGVQHIVGIGKIPAAVSDVEIEALQRVVASGALAEPHDYLSIGQRVRIREGSLHGLEGILVQVKNSWRIILSVDLLQRSVCVEVDRAAISPVRSGAGTASGPPPSAGRPAAALYRTAI